MPPHLPILSLTKQRRVPTAAAGQNDQQELFGSILPVQSLTKFIEFLNKKNPWRSGIATENVKLKTVHRIRVKIELVWNTPASAV